MVAAPSFKKLARCTFIVFLLFHEIRIVRELPVARGKRELIRGGRLRAERNNLFIAVVLGGVLLPGRSIAKIR